MSVAVADDGQERPPDPSPELMALAMALRAYMRDLPPSRRARFLSNMERGAREIEALSKVARIRSGRYDAEVRDAQRQAVVWWRSVEPLLTLALD